MLVVVQFPISDARTFSTSPHARLNVPDWPAPVTFGNPQFIRRFGPAAERVLGADAAWTDEGVYCRARRAVKFPGLTEARLRADYVTVEPFVAFRRVFCDRTTSVARVEIGIAAELPQWVPSVRPAAVQSIVRDVLGLDAVVFDPSSSRPVLADLVDHAPRLARLFAFASTRRKPPRASDAELQLVQHGTPMVVAEFDDGEVFALPKNARNVDKVKVGDAQLAWYDQPTPGGDVPVWVLRRGTTPEPMLRSLRLCLLRLHAERECLDRVLGHISRGRVTYVDGSVPSDLLGQYLDDSTAIIEKQWAFGLEQSQLLAAMEAAEAVSKPNRTKRSLDGLKGVRRQILVKAQRHALELNAPRAEAGGTVVVDNTKVEVSGTVHGTVVGSVHAQTITNSFNSAQQSAAPQAVKDALAQLQAAVEPIVPQLSNSDQKKVKDSVAIMTEQATSDDPIEDFVRVAAKTLVDVGEKVGDLAKPISTAVKAVLGALKFVALI